MNSIVNPDFTKPWQTPVPQQLMQKVEQRMIRQLLQALIFEEIVEFATTPTQAHSNESSLVTFTIPCVNGATYIARGRIHTSFGLVRLNEAVKRQYEDETIQPSLEMVISDILLPIEDATLKESFITELRHTFINDIQSSVLSPNTSKHIDELSYDQLESHLMAGHPYHPCYKSRVGFSLAENYQYGPEFNQHIEVVWLAVKHEYLAINSLDDVTTTGWAETYVGTEEYLQLQNRLAKQIKNTADYGLIPAHPWQWENTLINTLQPLIQSQDVIYLGSVGETYHAQQSIRSLSMVGQPQKHYLKLAMHLTNTSSTRILAKHTVMNAAVITKWLNQLITDDDVASAMQFSFLGETVGVSIDHEVLQSQGYSHPNIYGGLGAIWRENVSQYVTGKQKAFPLNGVTYVQPDDSKLIDPWLQKHGVANWVEKLIDVTVPPLMHLLFAKGVALESHAQNIVLVHEDGYPVKILLKDLHDGVRYSPEHLAQPELKPNLYSLPAAHAALNRGSFIETANTHIIRDMAVACLFFVAFADIAIFMQEHYDYSETRFWQVVADSISNYQTANPEHHERFELYDVFAKQTCIESLAKRRLFGDSVFPIKFINNPLHDTKHAAIK